MNHPRNTQYERLRAPRTEYRSALIGVLKVCRRCKSEYAPTESQVKKRDFICFGCRKKDDWDRRSDKRKLRTKPLHGRGGSPENLVWMAMIQRCHNPKNKSYPRYGGRGIYVCQGWRDSFVCFLFDMGPRRPGMTVERIDNDGPYAPWNCRWATYKEQCANTRRSRLVTAFGITAPLAQWVPETLDNEYHKIKRRLNRGWQPEIALAGESITIAWG